MCKKYVVAILFIASSSAEAMFLRLAARASLPVARIARNYAAASSLDSRIAEIVAQIKRLEEYRDRALDNLSLAWEKMLSGKYRRSTDHETEQELNRLNRIRTWGHVYSDYANERIAALKQELGTY